MKNNYTEKQVEKMLNKMAQEAKPAKEFQERLKMQLEEKFQQKSHKNNFWNSLFRFKLRFAGALVAIILTSTTIYAYNSDSVVRGDLLYPLKTATERVEGFFARTPERRALYYEKMAKRREAEIRNMENKDLHYRETVTERERLLKLSRQEDVKENSNDRKIEEKERPLEKEKEVKEKRALEERKKPPKTDFLDRDRKNM